MSIYPSTIPYTSPLTVSLRTKTLVSSFDELGAEQRKQKWLYPKREIRLTYPAIEKSEAAVLWKFHMSRGGPYESFSFFESTGSGTASNYNAYVKEYVATGDSTTMVFPLPAKASSASHTVLVSDTIISSSRYTFAAAGGPDGEDKITFKSTATGGLRARSSERITYSFTGRLKVKCRFADDVQDFDSFYDRIATMGVKLKGLLNA
jgi:hypothetical protein